MPGYCEGGLGGLTISTAMLTLLPPFAAVKIAGPSAVPCGTKKLI